jgi:16S rRNA C967 or C1407 C5-methylase (RsmB/RsmF family)
MRETTPAAMPPCFDKWCKRFDDLLRTKAQKREFRDYLGGLLGESKRKNIYQMASDSVTKKLEKIRVDEYAKWLSLEEFKEIIIQCEKPRKVWVAILEVEISQLEGQRKIAIIMNAPVFVALQGKSTLSFCC